MSISPINFIKEQVRQAVNQDSNFYQKMTYYFELYLPQYYLAELGAKFTFMFPLVIPPESYSMEEPFAVELTPTQRGGLFAEENGIIQRIIRIKGNTGFKPRMLRTHGGIFGSKTPPVAMAVSPATITDLPTSSISHSRRLPDRMFAEVSGHRHFQYLQDSVFRIYGDLKRDPTTAKSTMMFFHNPKDEEHFKVVPLKFSLDRDKSKPTLYNYNIELAVVGKADNTSEIDFDDKNILDALNDALYMAGLAEDLMVGTINDLIAMQSSLKSAFNNVTVLIDGLTSVVNATKEFTSGVKDFIDAPYSQVIALIDLAEAIGMNPIPEEPDQEIPAYANNLILKAPEGLELLATNPAMFKRTTNKDIQIIKDYQEFRRRVTKEQQDEIMTKESPSSFSELEEWGTAPTPGEVTRSGGEILVGGDIKNYKNMRVVDIGQNDTLAILAAKYLGDARLWQYIAVVNGLKPPYVDNQASLPLSNGGADERLFNSSLGIGSKILIPTNSVAPKDFPISPVLGVELEESIENQILGTDALLEPVQGVKGTSTAVYDIPINTELGSTDIKLTSGMDNMIQVVRTRLLREQGTDSLYKNVGIKRIIGLNFLIADLANARYRIRESVEADSRVSTIKNLQFEQQEDGLSASMEAQLRGFSESKAIQVTLKE